MKEKKYRIPLTGFERGVLRNSLMEMRNGLIQEGKDAEPDNALIVEKRIYDEISGLWYELQGICPVTGT